MNAGGAGTDVILMKQKYAPQLYYFVIKVQNTNKLLIYRNL